MANIYIPAIVYHQVLSDDMPVRIRKPGEGLHCSQIYLSQFIEQMDFLSAEGFTTITVDRLHQWLMGRAEMPTRPIVLDFDDHSMISFKNALPVMCERGQVATMYVVSGLADGDPTLAGEWWSVARMRWRELARLVEAGWLIAAHTRTHAFLTELPQGPQGDARVMDELVRCRHDTEANLGITPQCFAYPNGLWNHRVEAMVRQVYETARHFHVFGRAHYVTRHTDPYRLPTMNVNYTLSFDEFKRLVTRSAPEYEYYSESRIIGHAGTPQ